MIIVSILIENASAEMRVNLIFQILTDYNKYNLLIIAPLHELIVKYMILV